VSKHSPQVLIGTQYTIIPFLEDHISERYISWLNDPEVNRFLEVRHAHQTYETVLPYVRSFYSNTEKYMWGLYPNGMNKPIGTATLYKINHHLGWGEIGLVIGEKDYWGKGVSSETIELMLQFAFETLGLRRITGGSYASNRGMNFTFKMLGFTREGTLRQAYLERSGNYVDAYRWAILVDEWISRKDLSQSHGD
jgi:RimJ/RimL family protein N-acetyltransferase